MPELIDPPVITQEPAPAIPERAVSSLLNNISVNGVVQPPVPASAKPEKTGEPPKATEEEPKVLTSKEEAKPEHPKPEPAKAAPKSPAAEANFRQLEQSKVEAEKARDGFKAEVEQLKGELSTLRSASNDSIVLKERMEKAEQENVTLRQQLRTVAVERDPDFQTKYDGNIHARTVEMANLAISSGSTEQILRAALSSGDEDALANIRDGLKPAQQRAWDGHLTAIENLKFERKRAVENSEQTWGELEAQRTQRDAQSKEVNRIQNLRLAEAAVAHVWQSVPALQEADPAIRSTVTQNVRKIVGELTKEEIITELVMGQMRGQIASASMTENQELKTAAEANKAKIEELEKKLAEQDEFIKAAAANYRGGSFQSSPSSLNGGKPESLLNQVRIHAPGIAPAR